MQQDVRHPSNPPATNTPPQLRPQVLGDEPSPQDIASGAVTPLFFGSAFNNAGVDLFLQVTPTLLWGAGPRPVCLRAVCMCNLACCRSLALAVM